jgi:hypothetical protein
VDRASKIKTIPQKSQAAFHDFLERFTQKRLEYFVGSIDPDAYPVDPERESFYETITDSSIFHDYHLSEFFIDYFEAKSKGLRLRVADLDIHAIGDALVDISEGYNSPELCDSADQDMAWDLFKWSISCIPPTTLREFDQKRRDKERAAEADQAVIRDLLESMRRIEIKC